MSLQMIQSLQTELKVALVSQNVKVFFHKGLGEDYGRYCDNGTIFVFSTTSCKEMMKKS